MCDGTSASLVASPFGCYPTFTHLPHYKLTHIRSIHSHKTHTGTWDAIELNVLGSPVSRPVMPIRGRSRLIALAYLEMLVQDPNITVEDPGHSQVPA